MSTDQYRKWVGARSLPRNYSVVVMLTALSPHRQCQVCRAAADEFQVIANSFRHSPEFKGQLFFASVDFDDGAEVFQQLGVHSAPVFLWFGIRGNPRKPDQLDVQRIGFAAEVLAKWISERADMQIRVRRPPSYTALLLLPLAALAFGSLLYIRRERLEFLRNRTGWAVASLAIVFAMTSGQMWNHIRGPPLMQRTQKGVAYIHGGTSGQFVIETYLVLIMNVAVALGMGLMRYAAQSKIDSRTRRVLAVFGLGMTAIFFSLLLSVFKSKAHGYPYTFLFK
jgi:oligosaccharyltransferase complex subunit gamma